MFGYPILQTVSLYRNLPLSIQGKQGDTAALILPQASTIPSF